MTTTYCYACDYDLHACTVCGHLAGHNGYCGECEEGQ